MTIQTKARTHEIAVTVEKDRIQVEPDTLTMTSNDEVYWKGTTPRGFSIVFDGEGPFASREIRHADATTGRHKPRGKGRHKYTVVSDENPGLELDPVIIIEEPPTGSGTP